MQRKVLYRFTRTEGGVTVSMNKPDRDYETLSRLIADAGKVLTDGTNIFCCVDTDKPEQFYEIDIPSEDNFIPDPTEATTSDLYNALEELGVK